MSLDNITHSFVNVNKIKLHYVEAGSGSVLVLIHGFPDFWYTWKYQIPFLSQHFRVIAPDLRGYNQSDKPEGKDQYSMTNLVTDFVELISSLGERRVYVVGHDWGGAIAWNLAIRVPQLVKKLIVINSPHPIRFLQTFWNLHLGQYMKSWYVLFFMLEDVPEVSLKKDNFKMLREMVSRSILTKENLDLDKYVEAWAQEGTISAMVNMYRANWNIKQMLSLTEKEKQDLLARFPNVKCDSMLVWGEKDFALDITLIDETEKYIDGKFRLERLDAGHWVHIDKPDQVNELIFKFLKE